MNILEKDLLYILETPTEDYDVVIDESDIIELEKTPQDNAVHIVFDPDFKVFPTLKLQQLEENGWKLRAFGRNHRDYSNITASFEYRGGD